MMLDHIGENEMSKRISDAVAGVIAKGEVRTYDMLRLTGGPEVFKSGAATTQQMTDTIIAEL
jgi:3-isopropylmalate dehydrogenase